MFRQKSKFIRPSTVGAWPICRMMPAGQSTTCPMLNARGANWSRYIRQPSPKRLSSTKAGVSLRSRMATRLTNCPGHRTSPLSCTLEMVPGGRVELPTPAFSGPRSTGELPRHRRNPKIVAAQSCDVETESLGPAIARPSQFAMWRLLQRFVKFPHPLFFLEDLAGLGTFGRTDNPVLFHDVDEPGCTAVTDAQASLQRRSRGAAHLANHAHGLLVKFVINVFVA